MIKKTLCVFAMLSVAATTAQAADKAEGKVLAVREAVETLKRDAIPVVAGQTIKDPAGCLYGVTYYNGRLNLIPILDESKRPACDANEPRK